MHRRIPVILGCALLTLCGVLTPTDAQLFGKNKVTYHVHDWQVYASPHFDVHYYPPMEPFIQDIVSYAESAYLDISRTLDHELRFRVPLVVYKTHGEFQQTNILLAELPDGVAAFAEPVQYRMVLPIDLPPDELYELIAHELTHIFQYSIFFEGYLGRALRSRAPTWLIEGMASYVAQDEDNLDQMVIRDAVVNNILPPIQALNQVTFLTYRYGHAVFDFIEQEHGIEGLRSFIFEFKKVLLTGNAGRAIKEAFGYDVDEFNRRFNRFLRRKYFPILLEKKSPDEYGTEVGERRLRRSFVLSPTVSPSGELIAALGAPRAQELDLLILSAEDGSVVKNLTRGWTNKYRNLVTEAFDGKRDLSWSPTADQVAVFARRENQWPLYIFDAIKGKVVEKMVFEDLFEAASPTFSPDGTRIAFEANRDGEVDIFEVEVATGEVRNLTQDEFFDANPWYSEDGSSLLYNRRIGDHWKIFSVDTSDPSRKTQLTFGRHNDLQPAYSRDAEKIYFSSDRNDEGIFNIYSLDLSSGDLQQFTDVVGGCFSPAELAARDETDILIFQAFFEGRYRLYRMPLNEPEATIPAAERFSASDEGEAEEFAPELNLRLDEDKKAPYRVSWDIEAPSVGVGVADDGTVLSNAQLTFTDLLGNQRISILGQSVASFQQYQGTYVNLKRRFTWGAQVFDIRDFVFLANEAGGADRRTEYRATGANVFYRYPFSRHLRFDTSLGFLDTAQLVPVRDFFGGLQFTTFEDQFALASVGLTGDTTRFQRWGPFQGKRFNISTTYGNQLSGDSGGDLIEHRVDFRAYQQATRRSLLAFRLSGVINTGDRETTYGFGGINQVRGYDFREFIGSNIAWMNLEFRFPLIDRLQFPILSLFDVRGFAFFDVGAAWFDEDVFYDPDTRAIRQQPLTGEIVPFDFWDSENDRLQDGRASYGFGLQFLFLGGLQLNWAFSERLDYTRFVIDDITDPLNPILVPIEQDGGERRTDFYIVFDW